MPSPLDEEFDALPDAPDLDAEFDAIPDEEPSPPPRARFSAPESAAVGAGSGLTLGFGDELGGAEAAVHGTVGRGLRKVLGDDSKLAAVYSVASQVATGVPLPRAVANYFGSKGRGSAREDYEQARDSIRGGAKEAQEANPKAYLAGEIAGAVAVPVPGGSAGAATGVGRALRSAGQGVGIGAAYGAGMSEADLLQGDVGGFAADTGVGAAFGGVGGALGQGAGEALRAGKAWVAPRVGAALKGADDKLAELAQEKVRKDLASASGDLGSVVQQGNRLAENILRLEQAGNLTPQQMAVLQSLKAERAALERRLADAAIDDLPGKVKEIDSRQSVLSEMQGNRSQLYDDALKEVSSPMSQVAPRLKRYAAPLAGAMAGPVAGGAMGFATGGGFGSVVGGLAGAGVRPAAQAIGRMVKHPAVQKPVLQRLSRMVTANPQALGRYAKPLATAAAKGEQQFAAAHYVLAQRDPEYRDLVGQIENQPQDD